MEGPTSKASTASSSLGDNIQVKSQNSLIERIVGVLIDKLPSFISECLKEMPLADTQTHMPDSRDKTVKETSQEEHKK